MGPRELPTQEWETAVGRGAVYALLARALAYPSPRHLTELRDSIGPIVAGLSTGNTALDDRLEEVLRGLDAPIDELRNAHASLFTHIEPVDCPPYESAYNSADIFRQTQLMADVAAFYRAHGLRAGGVERERPDHITTELEFMGFMAHKEAHALEHLGPEQVAECRRTQSLFLRDHLGYWGPGFGRRVGLVAGQPLQRALGSLIADWLPARMEAL